MQIEHLIFLQPYQNKIPIGYVGSSKWIFQDLAADLFTTARLSRTVENTKLTKIVSLQQQIMTDDVLEDCVFAYSMC